VTEPRDSIVLRLVAGGMRQKDVAAMLGISATRIGVIFRRAERAKRNYWHVWTPEKQQDEFDHPHQPHHRIVFSEQAEAQAMWERNTYDLTNQEGESRAMNGG
jgi:hypothetical protein